MVNLPAWTTSLRLRRPPQGCISGGGGPRHETRLQILRRPERRLFIYFIGFTRQRRTSRHQFLLHLSAWLVRDGSWSWRCAPPGYMIV